jgi:hypothetical protein
MKLLKCAAGFGLLALLSPVSALVIISEAQQSMSARQETPQTIIRGWPVLARTIAKAMIEKYGTPDQFDRKSLVWFNKGPWKRTIVSRVALRHHRNGRDKDYLQQTIGFIVPADKVADVKAFNSLINVSRTAGELSFCSESEAKNFLAVNLAHDIAADNKTVPEARALYAKTLRLSAAGKSSPDMHGLMFEVDNSQHMIPTGADSD